MEAVRCACNSISIRGINVAGLPWAEIDFPYDLNRAQKEVWPAIKKSRWKRTIYWHKIKWAALVLLAVLLISAGWIIHLYFRDPNPGWTTILPSNGKEFILSLPEGTQRWWITSCDDTINAIVYGPSTVRVELRLVHFSNMQKTEQYVVEVSIDGQPLEWEVFKSTADEETIASDLTIGDRDRIEFAVSPGNHNISINLLAGYCDGFLVADAEKEAF